MMALLIQIIAGALGGNAAGSVAKDTNMGPLLNTILGAVGGGLRHQLDHLSLRHRRRERRSDRAGGRLPQGEDGGLTLGGERFGAALRP